jgi:hypothetical protein
MLFINVADGEIKYFRLINWVAIKLSAPEEKNEI